MFKDKILNQPFEGQDRSAWGPAMRYRALLEVNNAIVNQTCCETFFRSMAAEIRKIFKYDRFSISIYQPDSHSLSWFAMAEGIKLKNIDDGPRILEKNTVAGSVITSRKPLIIPDLSLYSHWHTIRLLMAEGVRTIMGFPLVVRGDAVGSFHFSFREPPPMMHELADFLVDLSGQVALAVDNMLSHTKLQRLNLSLQEQKHYLLNQVGSDYNIDKFYYSSPAMREIMRQVQIVADSDADVLITGETGTGKDCIAQHLHYLSDRRDALFVKVNCPALTPNLFESELFGHAKGAFTGANANRIGRFEMAKGGTIFLDEIGELSLHLQAKLLHVLQDRRFERVGDSRPIEVNFRVIAATNADLQAAIQERLFRLDLYYRLNTVSFHIPPLRERSEEVEPLVRKLTQAQVESLHRAAPVYSPEVMEILKRHTWPGNVRELKSIVSHLMILFSGKLVTKRDIEPLLNIREDEALPSPMTLAEVECAHLIKVLSMTHGVIGGKHGAAAILKMPKSTLQYKIRTHGLNPREFYH